MTHLSLQNIYIMFTGIIQTTGYIKNIQQYAEDWRIEIEAKNLDFTDIQLGDSIAVNGACLTVVDFKPPFFSVDVSTHTLNKTTLGNDQIGKIVNLEKCLQLNSYIGGHLVTGHVDAIGTLVEKREAGRGQELIWEVPTELLPMIAVKGSITLDGISLTVNTVNNTQVGVAIIPHTLDRTTLGGIKIGDKTNVEIDLLARYVARWLSEKK
jgi:riboflavin synthase